ncbi:ankyrin repeat-containing domain protein [Mycena galopus ATCC 62051]|nr:ankyrin repeat-containing domain protein [Mycena galopus ATCC 62051]
MGLTVNLMLMSRPHIRLPSILNATILEIRATNEDLQRYVDQQIRDRHQLALHVQALPELREQILTGIVGSANGMFLLAKLHTESLAAKTTIRLVRDNLENLPKDLDDAYKDTMDRIHQQRMGDWELAIAALIWVANTQWVLTVAELCEALAVKPGAKNLNPDDCLEISIILDVCAGLIITDDSSSTVWLVHYSTQRYLDGILPNAHAELARTCVEYLLHFENNVLNEETFPHYPLSMYAARYWTYHLQYCHDQETLSTSVMHLLKEHSKQYAALNHLYGVIGERWNYEPHWHCVILPPLFMSCRLGYTQEVQLLLSNGSDVNAQCIVHGSPLQAALENNHTETVEVFLKNGADINIQNHIQSCALQQAAAKNDIKTVQFLLEKGADINTQSTWHVSALYEAAHRGHTETVQLLLENSADIHIQGRYCSTALWAASQQGHIDIVCLLLGQGAKINVQDGYHGSAL